VRRVVLALVLGLALTACGDESRSVAPVEVDPALAPATLSDGLKLYENRDEETITAFANAGERTLVADGRIWEIRRADRLIGTLQISTVLPDVDLRQPDVRDTMVRQILTGAVSSIRIGDVEVFTSTTNDKAVYVWFGRGIFEVLQLRDRGVEDFEPFATEIIAHQATLEAWEPLPELLGSRDDDD